jgi:hypothetical protein
MAAPHTAGEAALVKQAHRTGGRSRTGRPRSSTPRTRRGSPATARGSTAPA